jgi:hypothetical protein
LIGFDDGFQEMGLGFDRMKLEQVFYGSGRKGSEETIILVVVVVLLIHSWLERKKSVFAAIGTL